MPKIIKHQHTLVGKNHLITKKNSKREKLKKANKTKTTNKQKKMAVVNSYQPMIIRNVNRLNSLSG